MRPATVHAAAQLVRHTRGVLTTIEKWVADTPPELLHKEVAEMVFVLRGGLMNVNNAVGTPRPQAAPVPADNQEGDRPAATMRPPGLHP